MESLFHVLEKNKNCAESGPGTQCRSALGLNIWVPAKKFECRPALFWKIRVSSDTPFWLFKTFFFFYFFQLTSFGHTLWNVHGQKKLIFLPFKKHFWHAWVRYNPMYACTFKQTRTRNVKTSIAITFSFVVRFECVTRRFDHADLRNHFKLFWGWLDVPRKIRSKL